VAILRGRLARIIPRSALIDSRTEVREIERHRNELGETSYGGLDRQQRRDRHVWHRLSSERQHHSVIELRDGARLKLGPIRRGYGPLDLGDPPAEPAPQASTRRAVGATLRGPMQRGGADGTAHHG
jgi:hypothetical protein